MNSAWKNRLCAAGGRSIFAQVSCSLNKPLCKSHIDGPTDYIIFYSTKNGM